MAKMKYNKELRQNAPKSCSLVLLLAAMLMFMACGGSDGDNHVAVAGIKLNKNALDLNRGETTKLTITVYPANASDTAVIWTSSASDVATVDNQGIVTAIGSGKATITATSKDGGKTAVCEVTVSVAVEDLAFKQDYIEMVVSQVSDAGYEIIPNDATDKEVVLHSSNSVVANVKDGKIMALSPGSATITVSTKNGQKSATCVVTVKKKDNINYKPYDEKNW